MLTNTSVWILPLGTEQFWSFCFKHRSNILNFAVKTKIVWHHRPFKLPLYISDKEWKMATNCSLGQNGALAETGHGFFSQWEVEKWALLLLSNGMGISCTQGNVITWRNIRLTNPLTKLLTDSAYADQKKLLSVEGYILFCGKTINTKVISPFGDNFSTKFPI